jgi:hypothetical protein
MKIKMYETIILLYDIVAYRPVAKQWLCKQRSLLGNAGNMYARNNRKTELCNPFKRRMVKHAYSNKGIVENGVFYSARAKWF